MTQSVDTESFSLQLVILKDAGSESGMTDVSLISATLSEAGIHRDFSKLLNGSPIKPGMTIAVYSFMQQSLSRG